MIRFSAKKLVLCVTAAGFHRSLTFGWDLAGKAGELRITHDGAYGYIFSSGEWSCSLRLGNSYICSGYKSPMCQAYAEKP